MPGVGFRNPSVIRPVKLSTMIDLPQTMLHISELAFLLANVTSSAVGRLGRILRSVRQYVTVWTATGARTRRRQRGLSRQLETLEERMVLAAVFVPGELLIQYADVTDVTRMEVRQLTQGTLLESVKSIPMSNAGTGMLERISLPSGMNVEAAARYVSRLPGVLFAEPNYWLTASATSNDSYYNTGNLWGMYSDDAPTVVGPAATNNRFGSQAEEAWNNGFTGSKDVIVGIIDTGIQFTHPDLDANIWVNPFEIAGDRLDNDGNGYIDDVRGWDFYNNDSSIYDTKDGDHHGTHVAGTIGAEGGNGIGVAGVNWNVTMIGAKFLGPGGGSLLDAVRAIDYLTDLKVRHGLNIVATNNSWGGGGYSVSLQNAITRAAKAGILFIAAAGNDGSNNDSKASYPANYSTLQGSDTESAADYEAVISVASITNTGNRSSFSNYGSTTVDLGAPGSSIFSTVPNGYASYNGTSMATPHVTGAVALYAAANPTANAFEIRTAILSSVTPTPALNGRTVTGGRLNISAALGQTATANLAVTNVTISESSVGGSAAIFTVTLSGNVTGVVTVNYSTVGATAVSDVDFTATSGTLTFEVGETSKTVSVPILNDSIQEFDELFYLNLTATVGASDLAVQGRATIRDDDASTVAIGDVSVLEGNAGMTSFIFTVSLSAPSVQTVRVNYLTANGTATSRGDYVAAKGTVQFNPGETVKTITISVRAETLVEQNETFFVNLSGIVNSTLADSVGVGTIINDDGGTTGLSQRAVARKARIKARSARG